MIARDARNLQRLLIVLIGTGLIVLVAASLVAFHAAHGIVATLASLAAFGLGTSGLVLLTRRGPRAWSGRGKEVPAADRADADLVVDTYFTPIPDEYGRITDEYGHQHHSWPSNIISGGGGMGL